MFRKSKKTLSVLIVMLIICSCSFMFAFAADEESVDFSVKVFGKGSCEISWSQSELDDKYYFFMPSDSDLSSLTVCLNNAESLTVNKEKIKNGEKTDVFKNGGEFTVKIADKTYQVVFLQSENLPSIFIETESGSLDTIHASKKNKEKATIKIVENGEVSLSSSLSYIKGRGNSTWKYDKKPYNIKFEKKTNLFSMGEAKKWTLIASADENSLIRNKSVYDLANDVGLLYSSNSQHVDLYINGDYRGTYLVCESVEVGSERVNITDLEKANEKANPDIDIEECEQIGSKDKQSGYIADTKKWVDIPNDPEDISGGYFLEFEQCNRYYKEVSGFTTKLGQPVTVKSPEYASQAEVEYISSYYQEFEDALYSSDGTNSLGKYYSDYIDMTSMARMYIIQELVMNLDASTTSFYLIKDKGSDKFVASPVWDFDYSLGKTARRNGIDLTNPDLWYVKSHYIYDTRGFLEQSNADFPTMLTQLCTYDDFMQVVKKEWESSFLPQLGTKRIEQMTSLYQTLTSSAVMDAIRWNKYETTDIDENAAQFASEATAVISFLEQRTTALSKGFSEKNANLIYDANGGSGCCYNSQIVQIGEKATVKINNFVSPGFRYFFKCWNTEPDGSGTSYVKGDLIEMDSQTVTLYAQWEKASVFRTVSARTMLFLYDVLSALVN